jgi:hypothetical protein
VDPRRVKEDNDRIRRRWNQIKVISFIGNGQKKFTLSGNKFLVINVYKYRTFGLNVA